MKVQVLQHVPFEGLGSIETWLSERGALVQHTRFYQVSKADLAKVSMKPAKFHGDWNYSILPNL